MSTYDKKTVEPKKIPLEHSTKITTPDTTLHLSPQEKRKEKAVRIFDFIYKVRYISKKLDELSRTKVRNNTEIAQQLKHIFHLQSDLRTYLESHNLPFLSPQVHLEIKNKHVPILNKKIDESFNSPDTLLALQELQTCLLEIAEVIKTEIAEDEDVKRILSFKKQVELVDKLKQENEAETQQRARLARKRDLIKDIIAGLIVEEMKVTATTRNTNLTKLEQADANHVKSVAVEAVRTAHYLSDEEMVNLAREILNLDRNQILHLNPQMPKQTENLLLKNLAVYHDQRVTKQDRLKYAQELSLLLDKILEKVSARLEFTDTQGKQTAVIKILTYLEKHLGYAVDIISLEDQLYYNEAEIIKSEQAGTNSLSLYQETLLTSNFFHQTGENQFMGMYFMLVTLGLLEHEGYNPLALDKKLTEIFIIDAYAKRRSLDTETKSGSRWLLAEEILTYFAQLKESFSWTSANAEQKAEVVEKLMDWFWWNEVGRPNVVYKSKSGGETEIVQEAETDSFGPIVLRIYNKENVSFPVSKEHGKYFLRKQLTKEAQDTLKNSDQELFITATVYYQLHTMINERRRVGEKIGVGIESVPLPIKDFYYVTVIIAGEWKKIKIDGSYFTSNKYGAPGSTDNIAEFIFQYQNLIFAPNSSHVSDRAFFKNNSSQLKQIDQQDSKLRWEANNAYETDSYSKRMKVQNIQEEVADLDNFTASDIGISLLSSSEITDTDEMSRSLLTNTFGGKKQLNIIFGADEKGNINRIAETIAHRYLDGAPARTESEQVFEKALSISKASVIVRPLSKGYITYGLPQYEETHKHTSKIYEGKIDGDQGKFRERCTAVYEFFNKKLGVEVDKNTVIQLAVHLFLNISHTHFLESRDGILAPAMSFCPTRVMDKMRRLPLDRDTFLELLASTQVMKADRMAVKAGHGMIPTNAMLTGAHSASASLRTLISETGKILNAEVAVPLTESVLVSAVSGSKKPFPSHPLFPQDQFTTALDSVYLRHGAIGISDIGDDISVTYRTLNTATPVIGFNNQFNDALELALKTLEQGMQLFVNEPDLSDMGKIPWKKQFKKLDKEKKTKKKQEKVGN